MLYIYLTDTNVVAEIIPEENPIFPGIPIEERYAPDFLAKCVAVSEDTVVEPNWVYDPEVKTFSEPPPPPEPEPLPDPEPYPEPEPEPGKVEELEKRMDDIEAVQNAMMEGL